MAIREHDLQIRHRSGRSNACADALSHNPVVAPFEQQQQIECAQVLRVSSDPMGIVDEDIQRQHLEDIAEYQFLWVKQPFSHIPMIDYLKSGQLPGNESQAKKLVMEHSQYDLVDMQYPTS